MIEKGTVFLNNRNQAIRLPKAAALPDGVKHVDIIVDGNRRIITPAGEGWTAWFDGPDVTDDFMAEREQPQVQDREGF